MTDNGTRLICLKLIGMRLGALLMTEARRPLFSSRNLVALIAAPPLGAGIYSLLYAAAIWLRTAKEGGFLGILDSIGGLLLYSVFYGFFGLIVGSLIGYVGMLITGIPSMLLLRYIRWENRITYIIMGGLGGSVIPPTDRNWTVFGESYVVHNVIAGALVMLMYFLIVDRGQNTLPPS
jgi:hypothetical protein